MLKNFYIQTFGCLMNEYDSQRAASFLKEIGLTEALSPEVADLVILNTCSVREKPQHKVNSIIGMHRKNRDKTGKPLKIGVMGCVAQQMGERLIKSNPSIDFVVGTDSVVQLKHIIPRIIEGKRLAQVDWSKDDFEIDLFQRTCSASALVTIMKGCNNFCSYCIVPYVRGRESSRKPAEIINEVKELVAGGAKEITLLGQNVNSYANNSDISMTFPKLLESVAKIDGVKRLRFVTSHPKDFSREMAEVMRDYSNICPLLHLPLQAGSDRILEAMNRKYTSADYFSKIDMARELIPNVEFSSDFIVGFPGETDEDYEKTVDAIKKVQYENMYVFNYSMRPGTKAEFLDDNVPLEVKTARLQRINETQEEIYQERYRKLLNTNIDVMVTEVTDKNISARTVYNRVVNFKPSSKVQLKSGDEVSVKITAVKRNSISGWLAD